MRNAPIETPASAPSHEQAVAEIRKCHRRYLPGLPDRRPLTLLPVDCERP